MKTRILTLALIGATLIFTACTDKKKKDNSKTTKTEKVEKSKDAVDYSNDSTKKETEAERRRLDSIRQVKEHGHAH